MNEYFLNAETQAPLMAESQRVRELLASKRAERIELPLERRVTDRRLGDRRIVQDRRGMGFTLDIAASKALDRRFTAAPITGFGEFRP